MKNIQLFSTVLAAAIVASPVVNAAENETVFNGNKLVIPHLVVGNDIYYAQLDRMGASYNFDLNEATLLKLTPQEGDDWATVEDLVGDWSPEGLANNVFTFEADGSYSITVPAGNGCTAGTETGTFAIDDTTGVLTARTVTDANGTCGLSHPTGLFRVERDGDNLIATIYSVSGGKQVSTQVTLLPN